MTDTTLPRLLTTTMVSIAHEIRTPCGIVRPMATPRSKLIDSKQAMHYHLVSRCVRGAFLTGIDPLTGKDYSHRKGWIEERMRHLGQYFSLGSL